MSSEVDFDSTISALADDNPSSAAALAEMTGFGAHKQHKSVNLQLWGNRESMNINSMVLTNIKQSPYFKYELAEITTFHEVVDAIYYKVSHLEPWERGTRRTSGLSGSSGGGLQVRGVGAGGVVSTAYCLLYKLFTLKINRKQLQTLLDHPDSPYIRAIGFMYIRYCLDPKDLWQWYEPYLDDPEEIDVKAGGGCNITIGEMLRQFLTQLDWYSTLFPRIPVPIEKDIRAKLQAKFKPRQRSPPEAAAPRDSDAPKKSSRGSDRSRSRSRVRSHSRDRDRDRDHRSSKHRDSRDRDRDRDHDSDRDRERHRDRDRQHKDRDRDRDRGGPDDRHHHQHHHHHREHRDKDTKDRHRRDR